MRNPLTMQNIYLRQRGKEHARRHYGRLLVMSLLVYCIVLALEEVLTLLGDALMARESAAFAAAVSQYAAHETIGNSDTLMNALTDLMLSPKYLLFNLVYIVSVALLSNGLNLGYIDQQLLVGKGGQPHVRGLFSRMKQCFKVLRLNLWMYLKIFLWTLPGLGTMALALIVVLMGYGESGTLLLLGGYVLLFALVFMAALRYSLSMYVLAENPAMGVIDCLNESIYLMKGHKRQLFKLGVPCIFIMLALFMATCFVGGMTLALFGLENSNLAMTILSDLALLVAMLFIPRLNMTYALFYLLRSEMAHNLSKPKTNQNDVPLPAAAPAQSPEDMPFEITDEKENHHEAPLC